MKICVAQTRPVKGDVRSNVDAHARLINLAASGGADTIIFPELSLTGYEPELAKELATDQDDDRFNDFQKTADAERMTIGVGVPTKDDGSICISMIIFQPHKPRQTYSKKYIHLDEEEFFVGGRNHVGLTSGKINIALAICYELSVPAHSEDAFRSGAEVYIASVAKSAEGVDRAAVSLSEIARKYSMTVLMSNCVGRCSGFDGAGGSSVWNDKGLLVGRLNDTDEGVLMIDTDTREVTTKTIHNE